MRPTGSGPTPPTSGAPWARSGEERRTVVISHVSPHKQSTMEKINTNLDDRYYCVSYEADESQLCQALRGKDKLGVSRQQLSPASFPG